MDTTQPTHRATPATPEPLGSTIDLPAELAAIVNALGEVVAGTQVGILAADATGTLETLAATDPLVLAFDDIQQHLDQGPSLTAIREDHTVIVDDAESEHRWPRFMPYAVDLGLCSYLGVSISIDDRTVGGLNLYSTTRRRLDADLLAQAKLCATQSALAIRHAQRERDLVLALQTSRTIGKAVGLVMERFELNDEEAFAYLARLSQRSNTKLRAIAAHLVKQSNDLRDLVRETQRTDEQINVPTTRSLEGSC